MKLVIRHKGGEGSGFKGHAGRPGEVGGSTSSGVDKTDAQRSAADTLSMDMVKKYNLISALPDKIVAAFPTINVLLSNTISHHSLAIRADKLANELWNDGVTIKKIVNRLDFVINYHISMRDTARHLLYTITDVDVLQKVELELGIFPGHFGSIKKFDGLIDPLE